MHGKVCIPQNSFSYINLIQYQRNSQQTLAEYKISYETYEDIPRGKIKVEISERKISLSTLSHSGHFDEKTNQQESGVYITIRMVRKYSGTHER